MSWTRVVFLNIDHCYDNTTSLSSGQYLNTITLLTLLKNTTLVQDKYDIKEVCRPFYLVGVVITFSVFAYNEGRHCLSLIRFYIALYVNSPHIEHI